MGVSKTNDRNEPIDMQWKVEYTRQAIVMQVMKLKHEDYLHLGSIDQDGR